MYFLINVYTVGLGEKDTKTQTTKRLTKTTLLGKTQLNTGCSYINGKQNAELKLQNRLSNLKQSKIKYKFLMQNIHAVDLNL